MTACQLPSPAQSDPSAPFGNFRLPPLQLPSRGNRHSQPVIWFIDERLQFSKYPPNLEGEDHEGETPTTGYRRELHYQVQTRPRDTYPQECLVLNQNI